MIFMLKKLNFYLKTKYVFLNNIIMVKKFCCNICYKVRSIYSIKNHLRLHGLKKIYVNCTICQKKISSNSIFKHYKEHEKKKENNNDNIKNINENFEKKFTIYGKKIYSNINKNEIVEELDKIIFKLQYYKNLILNDKYVIIKGKEKEDYEYKFTKKNTK